MTLERRQRKEGGTRDNPSVNEGKDIYNQKMKAYMKEGTIIMVIIIPVTVTFG